MIKKEHTIFLILLIIIVYAIGLFVDITGDAAKYATISRGILETGNFFELKIVDKGYLQKPPLLFWLVSWSFKIFGLTNFAYKLPTLLITLLGIFSTYKLASYLYGKNVGILASLMLATSQIYFLYNNDVHTDAILAAFVIFSIWQIVLYLITKKALNFILGFVGMGLTMMSKGPVGALVVIFSIGANLLLKKEFKQIFNWRWVLGAIIALIVVSPAIYSLYKQFGWDGITFFFWSNNTGRISSGNYSSGNTDYFFYLHTLAWAFLPWTAFLFYGLFKEFKNFVNAKEYYLIGGSTLYLIIVTIAKFKSPNYILAVIPLLTIIAAKWAIVFYNTSKSKSTKVISSIQIIVSILIWVLLITLLVLVFPANGLLIWILFGILISGTVISFMFYSRNANYKLFIFPLITILSLNLLANLHVFPTIFGYQGAIKAANIINKKKSEGDEVYNYKYDHYELFFYSKESVGQVYSFEELQSVLKKRDTWLFTNQDGMDEIKKITNSFKEFYSIKHKYLTRFGLKFFNPKTRHETFKNMYLLKL